MAVITQAEIEDRIGTRELVRLTDDAGTGSVDADNLSRAITEGESEILSRIAHKYVLPLALSDTTTSAVVKTYLIDAIVYRLSARRPPIPEDVAADYQRALAWADKVAAGTVGLVGETLRGSSPAPGGSIRIDATERVIDRESMSGL